MMRRIKRDTSMQSPRCLEMGRMEKLCSTEPQSHAIVAPTQLRFVKGWREVVLLVRVQVSMEPTTTDFIWVRMVKVLAAEGSFLGASMAAAYIFKAADSSKEAVCFVAEVSFTGAPNTMVAGPVSWRWPWSATWRG